MVVEITIEDIVAVGFWKWKVGDNTCHICFQLHEMPCPSCNKNGEACPPANGECGHTFHYHCVKKWYQTKFNEKKCPLCRQDFNLINKKMINNSAILSNQSFANDMTDDVVLYGC